MRYLIVGSDCWADEMDVPFFEVLTEEEFQKYQIVKEIFVNFLGNYGFGTNEGWDDNDFDFLQFEPVMLTDDDYKTLIKLGLVYEDGYEAIGYQIMDQLLTSIEDMRDGEGLEYIDLEEASVEEFRKACTELLDAVG